jgi:hypothetical protein
MDDDRERKVMDRTPRSHPVLLLVVILVGWALVRAVPSLWGPIWQLNVEIADVRVSIAIGAPPVRNRTALFDIGQIVTLIGAGR